MANPDHSRYVLDLKENDVLCGRGSGPNDRAGNIEFRNLILTRKAEYLAAKTREVKGRIASEIVGRVRERGGRFLKKLSPAQAKDAGFDRGVAVYELADEPTVLEKAKQTLRQNRAAFEKKNQDQPDDEEGGHANLPDFQTLQTQFNDAAGNFAAQTLCSMGSIGSLPVSVGGNNLGGSVNMHLNPIPFNEASLMLDSDKLPQMGSVEARHLQNALFASSSISSKDINSANQMNLSMDLSALLSSMGSNNSGGTTMSAERFSSLIDGFSAQDQASLIHQYKALQDQQHQTLMQQYEILRQQHLNTRGSIYPHFSSIGSGEMNSNPQQNWNMIAQQNTFNQQNAPTTNGQNNFSIHNHQNFSPEDLRNNVEGSSINSVDTCMQNNFSEDSLSRHHNQIHNIKGSTNVFQALVHEYPNQSSHDPLQMNDFCTNMTKQTSDRSNEISNTSKVSNTMSAISEFSQLSKDPVIAENFHSIARQQEFNDQQKLLQQYELLQSSGNNQVINPLPSTGQEGNPQCNDSETMKPPPSSAYSPQQRRPPRKIKREQSLTLANLKDDQINESKSTSRSSIRSSTNSSVKMNDAPKDSSLMSLMSMSMSLSEISPELMNKNPFESLNSKSSPDKEETIPEGVKESSNEIGDMSLSSLGEGWAADEIQR